VKIVRTGDQLFVELGRREQQLLVELLKRYPCVPAARHHLHRSSRLPDSSQRLLDEALAQQRASTKKQVQEWLSDSRRIEPTETGCRFVLSRTEVEWFLQVLNDIRVGSWVLLGAPDENLERALLNKKTAPLFLAMEMAGHFEMLMLEALQ
jgi:hypothetical protein